MRKSTAAEENDQLGDWSKWAAGRTNSEFFTAAFKGLQKFKVGNQGLMCIGLIGSRDIPGVALRRAQSILRWDRRPSHWSHAFLVGKAWNGKGKVDSEKAGSLSIQAEIPLNRSLKKPSSKVFKYYYATQNTVDTLCRIENKISVELTDLNVDPTQLKIAVQGNSSTAQLLRQLQPVAKKARHGRSLKLLLYPEQRQDNGCHVDNGLSYNYKEFYPKWLLEMSEKILEK